MQLLRKGVVRLNAYFVAYFAVLNIHDMDPNAWQQYSRLAQVQGGRFTIPQALLEQAASLSGITPQLTSSSPYSLPASAVLDTASLSGFQQVSVADNKLPPLSSLQPNYESASTIDTSWGLSQFFKQDTPEPPPAHSGQRVSQTYPYRGRGDIGSVTQAEQNLLMDHYETLRQQLQLLNPDIVSKPAANSHTTHVSYQASDNTGRYTPGDNIAAQEIAQSHQQTCQKELSAVQKYLMQQPIEAVYKQPLEHHHVQGYQEPATGMSNPYLPQRDNNVRRHSSGHSESRHAQAKYDSSHHQVQKRPNPSPMKPATYPCGGSLYPGSIETNSPASAQHSPSPHIATHSSPNIITSSYLSQTQPHQIYTSIAYNSGNNFLTNAQQPNETELQQASPGASGVGNYGGNIYEAVSPAASHPSQLENEVRHMQHIPTPSIQHNFASTSQVAHNHQYNAAEQQQNSAKHHGGTEIIQAPADSTTKVKKSRSTKAQRSGGSSTGGRSRKKTNANEEMFDSSQLAQMQTNVAHSHLQHHQQQMQQHQQQATLQIAHQASSQQIPISQHGVQQSLAVQMPPLELIQSLQAGVSVDGTPVSIASLQSGLASVSSMHISHLAVLQMQGIDTSQLLSQPQQVLYELQAANAGNSQFSSSNDDSLMQQVHIANELLGINHNDVIKQEDQQGLFMHGTEQSFSAQLQEDSNKAPDTMEENMNLGLSTLEYRDKEHSEMSETKSLSVPVSQVIDDEFGHLKPPEPPKSNLTQLDSKRPGLKKSVESSFQTSFLSFIHGNKQETLSSVTNSTIMKKPELPKYIPEPPRPKPKPKPESQKKSSVHHSSDFQSGAIFSDDDSSRREKTSSSVSNSAQGTSQDKPDRRTRQDSSKVSQPVAPLKLKIKMSDISLPAPEPIKSKSKRKSSDGNKARKRSSGKSRGKSDEYEVVAMDLGDVKAKEPTTPSPPVVRERVSRKAKEKVEEKRKRKQEKKKKRKSKDVEEESDFELSSDDGGFPDSDEREYDSDADPGWKPSVEDFRRGKGDFRGGTGVSMKDVGLEKKRPTPSKPLKGSRTTRRASSEQVVGKGRKSAASYSDDEDPVPPKKQPRSPPPQQTAKPRNVVIDGDSDDNSPHNYSKGDFVMERKELCNPDKFIIWKIDAGKLIQKYEPILTEDGVVVHKPLYTYSSWSDIQKPNNMGIEVDSRKYKGQDVVCVRPKYRPKAPDELLEKHAWMEAFNVFIQILISEVLEPGFLSLIRNPGEYEYYTGPLQEVETKLEETAKHIDSQIQWKPEFKEQLLQLPLLRITSRRPETHPTCQASLLHSDQPALKEARLYGEIYNPQTLNKSGNVGLENAKVFGIGDAAFDVLRRYHRLHHFKHRMYKKCLYMTDSCRRGGHTETSEILDQCLHNRVWIQLLFREFLKLIGAEAPSTIAVDLTTPTSTQELAPPTGVRESTNHPAGAADLAPPTG